MEEFTREEVMEFRRLASQGTQHMDSGCNVHAGCLYALLAKFRNDRKISGKSKAAEEMEFRARQIRRFLE
jgi:hypothetical protein